MGAEKGSGAKGTGSKSSDEKKSKPSKKDLADRHAHFLQYARLCFTQAKQEDSAALMGACWRSKIDGQIRMDLYEDWPRFDVVDLWNRDILEGSLHQFCHDEHIFLPIPLKYRTWLYHSIFLGKTVLQTSGETAMVEEALAKPCIDADVMAGRWSPLMTHAPMTMLTCFSGSMLIMMPAVAVMYLLFVLSSMMNQPGYYMWIRLFSLPFRLLWAVFYYLAHDGSNPLSTVAFLLSAMLMLYDFVVGDCAVLYNRKLMCSYEVIKVLPKRVFICRRRGAEAFEQIYGHRGTVAESLTGLGCWPSTFYLIADMHGILCELRPVRIRDWVGLFDEHGQTSRNLKFFAVGAYSKECPNTKAINCSYSELQRICAEFRASLALRPDSLLQERAKEDGGKDAQKDAKAAKKVVSFEEQAIGSATPLQLAARVVEDVPAPKSQPATIVVENI